MVLCRTSLTNACASEGSTVLVPILLRISYAVLQKIGDKDTVMQAPQSAKPRLSALPPHKANAPHVQRYSYSMYMHTHLGLEEAVRDLRLAESQVRVRKVGISYTADLVQSALLAPCVPFLCRFTRHLHPSLLSRISNLRNTRWVLVSSSPEVDVVSRAPSCWIKLPLTLKDRRAI